MTAKKQSPAIRFEKKIIEGFKAAKMYAPVETLTPKQYLSRKKREAENQKPFVRRFS